MPMKFLVLGGGGGLGFFVGGGGPINLKKRPQTPIFIVFL